MKVDFTRICTQLYQLLLFNLIQTNQVLVEQLIKLKKTMKEIYEKSLIKANDSTSALLM